MRKRLLEGRYDDDDLENNITNTNNFGMVRNSESLFRENKRSLISTHHRDGTFPAVKNARMTSLLDNVSFCLVFAALSQN
jgi:hypothetical protein